jgi:hypothetical protein
MFPPKKRNIWIVPLGIVFIVSVVFVSGFILIDRLTSRQQNAEPAEPPGIQAPAEPDNSASSENTHVISDKNLIGLWSTEGPSGEMVDPATGYGTGSIYNGEWYLFRKDGTFRYVIVGSGQILSGSVVWEGKFSIRDDEIRLTNIKECWYPDPAATGQKDAYEDKRIKDTTIQYRYGDDENTLIVNDADNFTRVAE